MATQVQFRRGNTYNMSSFTGANGEVVVDTDKETVVVHDGVTVGGFAVARESNTILRGSNSQFQANQYFTGTSHYVVANATFAGALNSSNLSVANSSSTSNVFVNTTSIYIGNSTGSMIVNSSAISINGILVANSSGTNNAFYLGGVQASAFQTAAGLAANVATLTSYNTLYVGAITVDNVATHGQLAGNLAAYQTSADLSSNVAGLSSNNSLYLGGIPANAYILPTSSATLSGNLAFTGANITFSGSKITSSSNVSLSGANTVISSANTVVSGNVNLTGTSLSVSANTTFTGSITGNSTTLIYGSGNTTISNNIVIQSNTTSNISINSSSIYINGGLVINSTSAIAANTANFIGTLPAANVVSNAQLIANLGNYQTTAGLSSNVAKLTANNTSFVGTVSAANVVSNAQLISNLANYQTTAGLSSNVATLTANSASFIGTLPAANVVSNAQLSSNLANYVTSTNLTNNLSNYQTTAGLSSNVATLTANNTSFVGTVSAANVVSNAQLSANIANFVTTTNLTNNLSNYQTTAGLNSNVSGLGYTNTAGAYTITGVHTHTANLIINGTLAVNSVIAINGSNGTAGYVLSSNGNSNVYWSALPVGVNTAAQYTWTNTQIFQSNVSFSNYILGTYVNAVSYTTGATGTGTGGIIANTTTIIIGNNTINTSLTSAGLNVNNSVVINNGGLYTSGIVNATGGVYGTLQTSSQPNITANNTSFVGSVAAANVVSNTQLIANLGNYQTTAGLTANIASYLPTYTGTVNASIYTLGTPGLGNGGFIANTTTIFVGNNTYNAALNTTTLYIDGTVIANSSGANNAFYLNNNPSSYYTNATNITTGTLPYTQLGVNVVNTTANFTIAGNTTFSASVTVSGTFDTSKANILANNSLSDSSGTISWDTSTGQIGYVTLTGTGRTMAAPTNLKVGTYILHVIQDATGSRTITTWNSIFKWPAGVAPVLTTTANSRDVFSFVSDGTNLYGSYIPDAR